LGIGNATLGAHLGGDVVRVAVAASTLALVEVGADGEIAVVCEPTRRLNVEFAPAREMVDPTTPGKGPGPDGLAT
jgi:hypothetical protein